VNARSRPLPTRLPPGSAAGITRAVEIMPITDADVQAVAEFLERGMSSGVSAAGWRRAMTPPWHVEQPNHGYFLIANGHVVGAYLAFYSERVIEGQPQRICNLGAWSVADEYRASGLRLLRSLLRQPGYTFTDLSPSGNVVPLNIRFGFIALDTTTAVVPNLPWPVRSRGVRVVDAPDEIDGLLSGRDLTIYRDHAATAAAHHVILVDGERSCYVVFRRDRRKRLPLFASILHVGDPELFRSCAPLLYRHLLLRHAIPATRGELRIVGHRPTRGLIVSGRPRMYLSEDLGPDQIDYLYSELTCVAW
jgi:hypothetical protein